MNEHPTTVALTIAGELCKIRLAGRKRDGRNLPSLERYATTRKTERTLASYDERALQSLTSKSTNLTLEDIRVTRRIYSRISEAEAEWFVKRSKSAPWGELEPKSSLGQLDPQLYEGGLAIYDHFARAGRRGIGTAKVSKVVYLARPAFFPILDAHLLARYRTAANDAAAPPGSTARRNYWVAISNDLSQPTTAAGLKSIRDWARAHESPSVQRLARLTDLRLLDIATWESSRNS